ncbi:SPOR domain-containing protein [Celerinatantimonas yamalensis]|uniref:SPOR domain-containing protein n=1 Tax=Celerinatantimonas yamalensis TaxID=559956 RepID=A0ABW9G930_9GAMM
MPRGGLVELSSQHQLLERLETLVLFSSHMIVVYGEGGAGKTSIAKSLLDRAEFANQAWLNIHTEHSDAKLRERILTQWLADPLFNADDRLLDSLTQNMNESVAGQLLVIDNAQFLSPQIFTELFELIEQYPLNYQHPLNIVLFSSTSFQQLSRENQWTVTDVLELDIEPLDEYDATTLAKQLLMRADLPADVVSRQALVHGIEQAQGNPGAICQVVEQTISGAGIMSEEQSKPRKPYLIWAIIAVLVAAVAGLAVQLLSGSSNPAKKAAATGQANINIPVVLPTKTDQQAADATVSGGANPANQGNGSTASSSKDNTDILPKPVTEQTIDKKDAPVIGQQRVVVDDAVVDQLMKAQQDQNANSTSTVASDDHAQSQPTDTQSSSSNAAQTTAPSTTAVSPKASPSSTSAVSGQPQDTESVLRAKPPRHYTLQLGAYSSMRAATDFAKKLNQEAAWVYPFQANNRILYKVIVGDFSDRRSAGAQQQAFKVKGQNSLIKSFRQVQFELNKK